MHYLDSSRYRVDDHAVAPVDDGVPLRPRFLHWTRGRIQRRGMPWYNVRNLVAEMQAAAYTATGWIDILHYLDPEHGLQYLPSAARLAPWRPRLVGTFHQPSSTLQNVMRRDVVRHLDHAVLVAPEQLPFFRECLPADRVSVILHGIDTDFFRPPAGPNGRHPWTCITVGHHLRDFAALRGVAERFRNDRDIRFQVVAPEATGLEDLPNVQVVSGLSDEELRARYQSADVLLLPLTNATANNALLEGLACGLPVVTSDLPAVRTYAPGMEAIRVPANDPGDLADALITLRNDPALATSMRVAARKRAEQLSWQVITPVYDRLYQSLLET